MDHAATDIPPSPLTWAYVDGWAEEDPQIVAARRIAASMGSPALSRPAGSVLRLIAASLGAQAVVEVGSGTGVSGGWILGGLDDSGTLTTVDPDPEMAAAARSTFTRMHIPHTRVRAIAGNPFDVLTRLTDG
ncbi:MAG: methyltransferase, partial [Actinomycetota bacterium]